MVVVLSFKCLLSDVSQVFFSQSLDNLLKDKSLHSESPLVFVMIHAFLMSHDICLIQGSKGFLLNPVFVLGFLWGFGKDYFCLGKLIFQSWSPFRADFSVQCEVMIIFLHIVLHLF